MDAIRVIISGPFAEAVERVKAAFKEEGFGTLTEIDVQGTLRERLGKEIAPYRVLGVCSPGLASRAIETEPEVGVYMPCSVLVRESAGQVHVAVQPPHQVVENTGNEALRPILDEVRVTVERVFARLSPH